MYLMNLMNLKIYYICYIKHVKMLLNQISIVNITMPYAIQDSGIF